MSRATAETRAGITERLAGISARRPWRVIAVWIAVLLVGGFLASGIGDVLTTEEGITAEPESLKGLRLMEERLRPDRASEFVIVRSDTRTVEDPQFRRFVGKLTADLRALKGTTESVANYYEEGSPQLVSRDRHASIVSVTLTGDPEEAAATVEPVLEVISEARARSDFEVLSTGDGSIFKTFDETAEKDLQRGEMIALPFALLILLVVFGAAVAAGVPVVIALVSIVISVGISALVGQLFELSFFVVNMITMIGLAVGIDYSLFVIQRVRDERAAGRGIEDALARAGATASRAVLFSGATVVVALAGLFIVPSSIYRSLAIGAIAVAAVSVAAALTLLPAALRLLGDRINALRPPLVGRNQSQDHGRGFWSRATNFVMARPLASTVASAAVLLAAAVPMLGINLGMAGISSLPAESESRQAFEVLDREFSGGVVSPMQVVVDANVSDPQVQAAIKDLATAMAADGMFAQPTVEQNEAGDIAVVSAAVNGGPDSNAAHEALRRVRNGYVPAAFGAASDNVYVTGETAKSEDGVNLIERYMPIVFAFVLGLSFVLLLVLFRSIVVPVKAIIMNLLSVGAAYGLLVLVFQEGVGNEIFGFERSETIEAWLPLFLFAVLFGLSMDYHVFLLSRIKERFDETGDNAGAVAYGMRSTSGLITGAALIMVTVFSGFATGSLGSMQQMGFGLAVAVIMDATIIRSVLVPASMQLLGELNWYLPNFLSWLPRVRLEPAAAQELVRASE